MRFNRWNFLSSDIWFNGKILEESTIAASNPCALASFKNTELSACLAAGLRPKEIFDKPKTYIYWKNDGEAVKTFKKTGPWYLHGIGGEKFFKKEGFTWRLISDDIRVRYLPKGYILDSGAPVGIINDGVDEDELYFIIGWLLTTKATYILKNTINHTKNIQSKDIEKLPYPIWVDDKIKIEIIQYVKELIFKKINSFDIDKDYKKKLDILFLWGYKF